jgi:hypothetical protein
LDEPEIDFRGAAALRRNSVAFLVAAAHDRSLRPNDDNREWAQTSTREREDSVVTVRRLNADDLDEDVHVTATSLNGERQPSLPVPNWSMFNNAAASTVDDNGEHVYQGIDLNYIMSVGGPTAAGSRRSSHSFIAPQPLPLPPLKDKSKSKDKRKKDKSKEKEFLDVAVVQGLIAPSAALPSLRDIAPWEADEMTDSRRPSTVTLDDSFAGGLRRLDPDYAERRIEWSFIREPDRVAFPPRDPNGSPRAWDVWRCAQIGKIRLERAVLPPSDPDKPNQQRLNAEHDTDPDCANNLGGPTTVVHRHSRALAFSIYRNYSLRNYRSSRPRSSTTTTARTQRSGQGRTALVMPTHDGILLATKRVQTQFTSTKSTSRLDTHGLLPEDNDNRREGRRPHPTHLQLPLQDSNPSHQEPSGPRHIIELSALEALDSPPASLHRSQSTRTTNSSLDLSGTTAVGFSSPAQSTSSASSASSISDRQLTPHNEAEEDSDDDFTNTIPRTSHAEAFATLDNFAIDQIKNEQPPVPAVRRSHGSWIQRWIGPPSGGSSRTLSSSLAPINPPWMTLIPRSMQEEQDRAIQGLRSSFKDVGLVPSGRPKSGAGIGRKGKGKNKDMLTQVPDDSLYMLLPLWPHETDPASAARERRQPTRGLDREQNLYLLVYYVPFEKGGEGNPAKKRSRSRSRKADHERHRPPPLFDARRGFKVVGRLIAHSDLNGSGIRLPVRGLSVTGSLAEAEMEIPPASLRDVHSDDFIIGACLDRSGTIEFVPEGLEKLGLCVPRTEPSVQLHTHPAMQTAEPIEEEVMPQPLTPIGRAAIEVAWLGCMALTTFYGPQSQDRA